MRNNNDSPIESTPVWEVPGDVPAARRHRAQAQPVRPDQDARKDPPTPDSRSGAYDQRNVRPALLGQVLSTHSLKRAFGRRKTLPGLAALLVVAVLLGVYAIDHTRTGAVSTVAASDSDLPTVAQAETPRVADAHEVSDTPSATVVPDAGQAHTVRVTVSVDQPAASPKVIEHVVKEGDTLWDLAEQYIQDPFRYPELARQSQIPNPDLIYPGQTVRIEFVTERAANT